MTDQARPARVPVRWVIRLALTFVALSLIAWWLPVDQLWSSIQSMPVTVWPVGVGVYLSAHLLGVAKWRLLVNAAGASLPVRPGVRAYYWGLFGSLFLPSIVGGDVIRAATAMPHVRSRTALVLGSLVDRVQDVAGLGVLAGIGALLAPRALDERSRGIFVTFVLLFAATAVIGTIVLVFFPARKAPFRVRRILARVRQALVTAASRPGALATAFAVGLVLQTSLVLLNWQLGHLIGIDVPIATWLFVWPLAKIAGLTPLTQGGLGVREAAQAVLFAPFGVSAVQAVAVGLVWAAVVIVGGLASGLIAVSLRRLVEKSDTAAATPASQMESWRA